MERREATRAKRARLLSPKKYVKSLRIRTVRKGNVTHIVRRMKKWSHAHHRQLVQVHRLRPAQIFPPTPLSMRTLFSMWRVNSHNPRNGQSPPWHLKGKSIGSAHNTGESTPLGLRLLFFAEIITLLVVETNRYYQVYLHFFDDGHSPQPELIEAEMIAF